MVEGAVGRAPVKHDLALLLAGWLLGAAAGCILAFGYGDVLKALCP